MTKENVKDLEKSCIVIISDFTILKCGDTSYEHIYSAFLVHFSGIVKAVVIIIMSVRLNNKIVLLSCKGGSRGRWARVWVRMQN